MSNNTISEDNVIADMGKLLLSGWTMLAESCPGDDCNVPLFELRSEHVIKCPKCRTQFKRSPDPLDPNDFELVPVETTPSTATAAPVAAAPRSTTSAPISPAKRASFARAYDEPEESEDDEETTTPSSTPAAASAISDDSENSEASKQKKIQRQRVSDKIGEKLLAGWTMMQDICPQCPVPLMKDKEGVMWCMSCGSRVIRQEEFDPTKHRVASKAEVAAAQEKEGRHSPPPVSSLLTSGANAASESTSTTGSLVPPKALPSRSLSSGALATPAAPTPTHGQRRPYTTQVPPLTPTHDGHRKQTRSPQPMQEEEPTTKMVKTTHVQAPQPTHPVMQPAGFFFGNPSHFGHFPFSGEPATSGGAPGSASDVAFPHAAMQGGGPGYPAAFFFVPSYSFAASGTPPIGTTTGSSSANNNSATAPSAASTPVKHLGPSKAAISPPSSAVSTPRDISSESQQRSPSAMVGVPSLPSSGRNEEAFSAVRAALCAKMEQSSQRLARTDDIAQSKALCDLIVECSRALQSLELTASRQ